MSWTVEEMREIGMSEQEIVRARCDHDYGTGCYSTFMDCQRTCQKCGQMKIIPGGCTPALRSTSASPADRGEWEKP